LNSVIILPKRQINKEILLDPSRITSWGINGASVDPKLLEHAFNQPQESSKSSPDEPISRVSPQRAAPPPPSKVSIKKKKERSPKMEKFEKKISRISKSEIQEGSIRSSYDNISLRFE